jgi:uncharacterized protein
MSKIVFWLVVVFVCLLALRLYNHHQLNRREAAKRERQRKSIRKPEPMVKCAQCGVFVPRSDARESASGLVCAAGCLPPKTP